MSPSGGEHRDPLSVPLSAFLCSSVSSFSFFFHPLRSFLQCLVLGRGESLCPWTICLFLFESDLSWHLPLGKHRKTINQLAVWLHLTTFSVYPDSYECPKIVWLWCAGPFSAFLEFCLLAKSHASPKSLHGQEDNKHSYWFGSTPRGSSRAICPVWGTGCCSVSPQLMEVELRCVLTVQRSVAAEMAGTQCFTEQYGYVPKGLICCCFLPFHCGHWSWNSCLLDSCLIQASQLLADTVPCYWMRKPRPERSGRKNGTNLWLISLIARWWSFRREEICLGRHLASQRKPTLLLGGSLLLPCDLSRWRNLYVSASHWQCG